MDHLKLTFDKLSVESISEKVLDNSCGAVSVFIGTTRDNFEGKKVVKLEYEAYEPMALKAMKSICEEIRSKWPAVHGIAVYHRLGLVPCREASVVVAVSSPRRVEAIAATSYCIDRLKATVPVWKREHYDGDYEPQWKENPECPQSPQTSPPSPTSPEKDPDKNLIQINVSNEELQQRIQNFIERKRDQVNVSNIIDFIPGYNENETEDAETCARVRTQFVKRTDSKGHLKIRKVHNEWGPQTVRGAFGEAGDGVTGGAGVAAGAGEGVAERLRAVEKALGTGPVARDVYRRLKALEDRLAHLQALAPEYSVFWKTNREVDVKQEKVEYAYSAEDISRKIELLERQAAS